MEEDYTQNKDKQTNTKRLEYVCVLQRERTSKNQVNVCMTAQTPEYLLQKTSGARLQEKREVKGFGSFLLNVYFSYKIGQMSAKIVGSENVDCLISEVLKILVGTTSTLRHSKTKSSLDGTLTLCLEICLTLIVTIVISYRDVIKRLKINIILNIIMCI